MQPSLWTPAPLEGGRLWRSWGAATEVCKVPGGNGDSPYSPDEKSSGKCCHSPTVQLVVLYCTVLLGIQRDEQMLRPLSKSSKEMYSKHHCEGTTYPSAVTGECCPDVHRPAWSASSHCSFLIWLLQWVRSELGANNTHLLNTLVAQTAMTTSDYKASSPLLSSVHSMDHRVQCLPNCSSEPASYKNHFFPCAMVLTWDLHPAGVRKMWKEEKGGQVPTFLQEPQFSWRSLSWGQKTQVAFLKYQRLRSSKAFRCLWNWRLRCF